MNIIYKINKNEKSVKILGSKFVENNKDNCFLLINNKKNEICEYYNLDKEENKSYLIIKLIEKKYITNMSYMFEGCSSLLSLPDISKWNTNDVTNMSYMISGCSSLLSLPDISKWNTINVKYMSSIFN